MMTFKKVAEIAVAASLIAGLGGAVYAQSAAADAIVARQAFMKSISGNMSAIAAATSATPADMAGAKAAAQKLADGFKALPSQFPVGSDTAAGKTRARPEIWTDAAYFKGELDEAIAASQALLAATGGTDPLAVGNATADLRETCSGCHGSYRAQAYL